MGAGAISIGSVETELKAEISEFLRRMTMVEKKWQDQAKTLTTMERALKKTGDGFMSLGKALDKPVSGLASFAAAWVSVESAMKAFDMARVGAQFMDAKTVFEAAGNSLEDFRKKTKGLLSDQVLVQKFNFASQMGINKEAFIKFAQVADAAAKKMGVSQEYAFNSLITGTARGSKLILDNVGILLQTEQAHEKYAAALGKTASKLTETEKKQAIMNAVMQQGDEIIKDVLGVGATASDVYDQWDSAIGNLKTSFGSFVHVLMNSDGIFKKSISLLQELADAFESASKPGGGFTDAGSDANTMMRNAVRAAGSAIGLNMGAYDPTADKFGDELALSKQFDDLKARIEEIPHEVGRVKAAMGDAGQAYIEQLNKELAQTKKQLEDLGRGTLHGSLRLNESNQAKSDEDSMRSEITRYEKERRQAAIAQEEEISQKRETARKKAEQKEKEIIRLRKEAEKEIAKLRFDNLEKGAPGRQGAFLSILHGTENAMNSPNFKAATSDQQQRYTEELAKAEVYATAEILKESESRADFNNRIEESVKVMGEWLTLQAKALALSDKELQRKFAEANPYSREKMIEFKQEEKAKAEADKRAKYEAEAAADEHVKTRNQGNFGAASDGIIQAAFGGNLGLSTVGTAIGVAAGGPMGAMVFSALEGVFNSFLSGLSSLFKDFFGDDRLSGLGGGAANGLAAGGSAALVGMVGASMAASAALLATIFSPFLIVLSPLIATIIALNALLIVGVVAVGAFVAVLAAIPMLIGGVFGLMGVFYDLSKSTKSYERFQGAVTVVMDKLVKVLEPFWGSMLSLVGLLDLFMAVLAPFADTFASMGPQIAEMLFPVIKGLALGLATLAFVVGLTQNALGDFVTGVGRFLQNDDLIELGKDMKVNTAALASAIMDLAETDFDEASARGELIAQIWDEQQSRKKLNDELNNAPSWFKIAQFRFNAARPVSPMLGTQTSVTQSNGGGGGEHWTIQGDVNVYADQPGDSVLDKVKDDLKKKRAQLRGNPFIDPDGNPWD